MLSRRALVGRLAAGAAGAAVAWVAGGGRASAAATRAQAGALSGAAPSDHPVASTPEGAGDAKAPAAVSAPPPWELLSPLAVGAPVAHGWRVADLSGVDDGSCVLTLRSDQGRAHRVHLCRNDGQPQGVVHTKQFDLVVMNGGQGDLPTDEGLAQAVAEVARVLSANEGGREPALLASTLLPHVARVREFGVSGDARLR